VLPCGVTRPVPPTRANAIAAICRLAAEGKIEIQRNAQKGIDRLDHDADFAFELLSGCSPAECEKDEPGRWSEVHHVYVFKIEMENELDLYVKVSLNTDTLESGELLSYKPYGSPE
jgi:hypothetical protein